MLISVKLLRKQKQIGFKRLYIHYLLKSYAHEGTNWHNIKELFESQQDAGYKTLRAFKRAIEHCTELKLCASTQTHVRHLPAPPLGRLFARVTDGLTVNDFITECNSALESGALRAHKADKALKALYPAPLMDGGSTGKPLSVSALAGFISGSSTRAQTIRRKSKCTRTRVNLFVHGNAEAARYIMPIYGYIFISKGGKAIHTLPSLVLPACEIVNRRFAKRG